MENLRRRTARDVHDARAYAVANFARDMLSVSDNLRRAIDAVSGEAREGGDASLNSLLEGVEMTERSMLSALERHGVKKLNPEGEKFDPNFHQAMFEIPIPTFRPTRCCRWSNRATPSVNAFCAPPWSVSPRADQRLRRQMAICLSRGRWMRRPKRRLMSGDRFGRSSRNLSGNDLASRGQAA
jgi:hypothetical protein